MISILYCNKDIPIINIYANGELYGKCFCTLPGFNDDVMWGYFFDVFGLPYRLASILI